jgi:hypothetical protein
MPKCANCKNDTDKKEVIKYMDELAKVPKKLNMCSDDCIENYKKDQLFKAKEKEEYANLCEYIMKIHNQTFLPSSFYFILRELRDGTIRQKDIHIKKHNQGVPWSDILISYKYSEDSIKKSMDRIPFDSIMGELKYSLAIVKNNLKKAKQQNNQKKMNDKVETKINVGVDYDYKKKDFSDDISEILN